jgi:hypothetical protein
MIWARCFRGLGHGHLTLCTWAEHCGGGAYGSGRTTHLQAVRKQGVRDRNQPGGRQNLQKPHTHLCRDPFPPTMPHHLKVPNLSK